MILSLIVAMTRERVIGNGNALPWRIPGDLKRFKAITTGHPIVMGRKTFDSIGRPLPNRQNIIISRQPGLKIEGVTVAGSLAEALSPFEGTGREIFVIGGGQIYREALPRAALLYVTWVEATVAGDTYFPAFNASEFRIAKESSLILEPVPHRFVDYERIL